MQEGAECGRPLRPSFLEPTPGCLDGPAHPVRRGAFFDRLAGHGRALWNRTESIHGDALALSDFLLSNRGQSPSNYRRFYDRTDGCEGRAMITRLNTNAAHIQRHSLLHAEAPSAAEGPAANKCTWRPSSWGMRVITEIKQRRDDNGLGG